MSDEVKKDVAENATTETKQNDESVDYKALYEDLNAKYENTQKAQAGSDKKVNDLLAKMEELRKSSMTDNELRDYEVKKLKEEHDQALNRLKQYEFNEAKSSILDELGIDNKFADLINGDDIDKLKLNAIKFKEVFDDAIKSNIDKKIKDNSYKPGSGAADNDDGYFKTRQELIDASKEVVKLTRLGKKQEAEVLQNRINMSVSKLNN